MVPIIETERLILRGFTAKDFDRYAEIWAEPEVVRYVGGEPRSRALCWASFLRNAGGWQVEGHGSWAVVLRASGRLVGQVGFFTAMRGVGEDFDAAPECGWVLASEAQGQGYGPEAVVAAHAWFDVQPFGGTSYVMIAPDHAVSLALARRTGYEDLRTAEYEGETVRILRRSQR